MQRRFIFHTSNLGELSGTRQKKIKMNVRQQRNEKKKHLKEIHDHTASQIVRERKTEEEEEKTD